MKLQQYHCRFQFQAFKSNNNNSHNREVVICFASSILLRNFNKLVSLTKVTDYWYCKWECIGQTYDNKRIVKFTIKAERLFSPSKHYHNKYKLVVMETVLSSTDWNHLREYSRTYWNNENKLLNGNINIKSNWNLEYRTEKWI